jgi:DNA-binding PadR family transcriptional regulator
MPASDAKLLAREILLSFWKVHILHHAAEHPIIGQWVLEELRRHGYDISPGTLYPLLKRLERNGWLRSEAAVGKAKRRRRYYHLTKRGALVLETLRETVTELHHEVVEEANAHHSRRPFRLAGVSGVETAAARRRPAAVRVTPRSKR